MARKRTYKMHIELEIMAEMKTPKWEPWLAGQLVELLELLNGPGTVTKVCRAPTDGVLWAEAEIEAGPLELGALVTEIETNFPEFNMREPQLTEIKGKEHAAQN